jgi:DNA-binding XRE family transcriptional regulator
VLFAHEARLHVSRAVEGRRVTSARHSTVRPDLREPARRTGSAASSRYGGDARKAVTASSSSDCHPELDLEPQTIGDHIKRRRLELALTQAQTAERLGVHPITVLNWEKGKTEPLIPAFPPILAFLGYSPLPQSSRVGEQLLHMRKHRSWSIREAACHRGVDPTTWCDWERGELILFRKASESRLYALGS